MQRYTVTFISDTSGGRPSTIIPFQPSALVTAFKDEVIKRANRQNLTITAETHDLKLRLQSQTGPTLDPDDTLADVVLASETIFAVFSQREAGTGDVSTLPTRTSATTGTTAPQPIEGDTIKIRVITPDTARQVRSSLQTFDISVNATLQQLHEHVAHHLGVPRDIENNADLNECNCSFAHKLFDHHSSDATTFVIHGKSVVGRISLASGSTEGDLRHALRMQFGLDIEDRKKVDYSGGELDSAGKYVRLPVIALCSRKRHIPASARIAEPLDECDQTWSHVLDLHTSEMPIHTAAMSKTISESGLLGLSVDEVLDIYTVRRSTTAVSNSVCGGKNGVFRDRAYWRPPVRQSDRGTAMFLASLRVTASLLQGMEEDPAAQDAFLHVFDLMATFPPALRTLHLLTQGKTPSPPECAALSHVFFHILQTFMPEDLIGHNKDRLFEGSRLLFGFLLEKGRTVKLHESQLADPQKWPYLNAFGITETRDIITDEPVAQPVHTEIGLVERAYFEAFSATGTLSSNTMQFALVEGSLETTTLRHAIIGAGVRADISVFCINSLSANYTYPDGGLAANVIDESELQELHFLAEICGRNKLAVHRPSQLTSAVYPCLTLDRNAHAAVYLGEQGCSEPGRSSLVFRPLTGATETPDLAVVEQLIEPMIKFYDSEGTSVFDTYGGASVRKLEAPDEILMFCVDCSASMRTATDFAEVNGEGDNHDDFDEIPQPTVEGEYYADARFEDVKEELCKHESFNDMLAIIASAEKHRRERTATAMITIMDNIAAVQLVNRLQELERLEQSTDYGRRGLLEQSAEDVKRRKSFYAGLRTHERLVRDFLLYRATTFTPSSRRWTWSPGDDVPESSVSHARIPMLPGSVTQIPDDLRCPISQDLMVDAVRASDGHIYSRHALRQWFEIRKSSPLHGTPLSDTSMVQQRDVINAALQWIEGDDLTELREQAIGRRLPTEARSASTDMIVLNFHSHLGGFVRSIPKRLSLEDLHKMVFRALKARHSMFQLVHSDSNREITPSPADTIATHGLQDGDEITVRIAEDTEFGNALPANGVTAGDLALVKIYNRRNECVVSYWVNRYGSQSVASIQWKYWRAIFTGSSGNFPSTSPVEVWANVEDSGDGHTWGYPQKDSTKVLSHYLNRQYCKGQLDAEGLFDHSSRVGDQPMVLKVQMCSPSRKSKRSVLSRLDVLKQMFEALINKIFAYNYKTHVGLVAFSSKASVTMPISHVIENFRRATNDMEANGDTAMFDALALAEDQVREYGARYPNAKKRIICISDGLDTKSVLNTAERVAWSLFQNDVALDSICLGSEKNTKLFAISHTLGCYKFSPFSLANALQICEMEVVLGLIDRPSLVAVAQKAWSRSTFRARFLSGQQAVRSTVVNDHTFPQHKTHPNMDDTFIPLADAARLSGGRAMTSSISARSNLRVSRLLNEMRQIVTGGPRATYDVYVSESDIAFWLVIMQGPNDTPYEGGTFMIYLHAEEKYPAFAPNARFVTRIKHPNISLEGRICHSIFSRDYTTDTSMTQLLDTVYGMLLHVEASDPVNTTMTLGYHHDQVEFNEEVREWTRRYASKTRDEWKNTLLEDQGADEDQDSEDADSVS